MTREQLKKIFKKLFILKFAPKEEWEFEIYLDEFINTKQEILEQAVDYILKNEVEFPKPATLWKVYNIFHERYKEKNTKVFECKKCGKIYFILAKEIDTKLKCNCGGVLCDLKG